MAPPTKHKHNMTHLYPLIEFPLTSDLSYLVPPFRDDSADPSQALKLDVEAQRVMLDKDLAAATELLTERLITLEHGRKALDARKPEHVILSLPTSTSMLASYSCSTNSRLCTPSNDSPTLFVDVIRSWVGRMLAVVVGGMGWT